MLMRIKFALIMGICMLTSVWLAAQVPAPAEAANVEKATKITKKVKLSEELEVPYISTYYVEPNVLTSQNVKISFYVTDWHQSEYRLQDKSKRFNVFLWISDGRSSKQLTLDKIPAGDHAFDLGKLSPGYYSFRLYAIDEHERYSPSIFHEFRVSNSYEIPAAATYVMSKGDLQRYGISNTGDYAVYHYVDATGKNEEDTKAIVEEAAKNLKAPSGKYLVVVGGSKAPDDLLIGPQCGAYNLPTPEWLPNHYSRRTAKVIYSSGYNKERVENDAERNGNAINKFLEDQSAHGYRKVVFLPGVYRISSKTTIKIPSNMTVDLNGATIKMNESSDKGALMVNIRDCYDSHVVNGILEGDYFEHDYSINKSSEWLNGIGISGNSKYCSIKNLVVRFITGYGVTNGGGSVTFKGFSVLKFHPGTISRKNGRRVAKAGFQVSQPVSVKYLRDTFGYITASRCLGYQGLAMDECNVMYHFYDTYKRYMGTIDGEQYRRIRVPAGAEYVCVTVWAVGKITEKAFQVNFFPSPQNCAFENIYIQNARCVGMAPASMYNHKIANCTFTRSGENLARCAFDAEDGWDMMQDVWIYRNRFIGNPNNELLTCAGHNFIFEENEAHLHLWSRTASYVSRNNKFKSANYGYANRKRTRLVRIENNNTYTGQVTYGEQRDDINPVDWMKAYADELAGKGKPFDGRWMLLGRGIFTEGGVATNSGGVIYGSDLNKMPKGAKFNLLMSRLRDTDLTWLASSNFVSSIIENGRFSLNKTSKKIVGCNLKNIFFQLSGGCHLILENCTLENVEMQHGYWVTPSKVTLINCTVKNQDKALFRTPSYSTGIITVENSLIDTGSAPAFNMYDTRTQKTDDQVGQIIFKNSDIVNTAGSIIKTDKGSLPKNQKVIQIDVTNTSFDGKVSDKTGPKWKINVSGDKPVNNVHRGWDPGMEQKIMDLIAELK